VDGRMRDSGMRRRGMRGLRSSFGRREVK